MNNEKSAPNLQRVILAEIKASQRLRPVSDAGVQSILASVAEIGQIKDPIHLRKKRDGLYLLAGGHRLAAYGELGITEVDAWVWTDITNDKASLIEIDDNLAGAEMCALDTAIFLAERKRVYENLHPEVKRGGDRKSVDFKNQTDIESVRSFVTSTAEKFGLSERHVRRLVEAGEKLGVDSARLRNIPRAVTLKDLIEISKVGQPTERYAIVDALRSGTAKSAAEARRAWKARETGLKANVKDPIEEAFNALAKLWLRAPEAAKRRFVREMEPQLSMRLIALRDAAKVNERLGLEADDPKGAAVVDKMAKRLGGGAE